MQPTNALLDYFPFLERQGEATNDMLASSFAIASVGIAMHKMLETLLPAAASEVEREALVMSDHFAVIANYWGEQKQVPEPVQQAIAGIITSMQFQDRNTQVMDNVAGMLERYRTMLEEVCSNIEAVREGNEANSHNIAQAVEHIISSIRLSDIRTRYLEALAKAKVHTPAEMLMMPATDEINDIELF